MKLTADELATALRQKRQGARQVPVPAKRVRRDGSTGTAVATAAGAAKAPPSGDAPAEERPVERVVPAPAGTETEEGEIPAATDAQVVVINLEEEALAAAAAPGAGQVTVAAESSAAIPVAAAEPGARRASVAAAEKRPVERGPSAGTSSAVRVRDEPSGSSQRSERRATRRPAEGVRRGSGRTGSLLQTMMDPVQASVLLANARTPDSIEEMRKLSFGSIVDGVMIATAQMVNYTFSMRDAVAESSQALAKALARVSRHKKEGEELQRDLAQVREASQAREGQLIGRLKEAEGRAEAGSERASAAETRLELALERLRAAEAQAEELSRSTVERIAAAEKAAVEAGLERAGAVACAEEASARAQEAEEKMSEAEVKTNEAETKAVEAEAKAKEAEARAQKAEKETEIAIARAIEEFKASAEFKQEMIESSLGAYVEGFQLCKEKVSTVLKINMSELEGIRPDGEEGDEDEAEKAEGKPGPAEP